VHFKTVLETVDVKYYAVLTMSVGLFRPNF